MPEERGSARIAAASSAGAEAGTVKARGAFFGAVENVLSLDSRRNAFVLARELALNPWHPSWRDWLRRRAMPTLYEIYVEIMSERSKGEDARGEERMSP